MDTTTNMEEDEDIGNNNLSNEGSGVIIPQEWKKKRCETMATFLLNRFLMGLEFNMLASTLWSYVNHGLQVNQVNFFYGLIASSRTFAGILFVPFAAKWYDTHRRMKVITLVTASLVCIGYVLYMISFSPYLPVVGGVLFGCNFILAAVINSEIHRVYTHDDIQQMFVQILFVYGAGEILGPMIVKLLDRSDFWIGKLHIVYGNMACLVLLSVNIIRMVLTVFFTHDLSREFDLKAAQLGEDYATMSKSLWQTSVQSLNLDTSYLLMRQLCTHFFAIYVGRALPVLIKRTLHYKNFILDLCLSGASIIMVILCVILHRIQLSSRGVYNCGVISLVGVVSANIALLLISRTYGTIVDIFLLSVLVFMYPLIWILESIFVVTILGKLSPSSVQAFLEGFRMTIYVFAETTGSLLCAIVYDNINFSFPLFCLITVVLFVIMVIRKEVLMDPQPPITADEKELLILHSTEN